MEVTHESIIGVKMIWRLKVTTSLRVHSVKIYTCNKINCRKYHHGKPFIVLQVKGWFVNNAQLISKNKTNNGDLIAVLYSPFFQTAVRVSCECIAIRSKLLLHLMPCCYYRWYV